MDGLPGEQVNITLAIRLSSEPRSVSQWQREKISLVYRVTMVVAHLGWVDLDLGCSTLLLGSR